MQSVVLSSCRPQGCSFCRVIPEIDIWRAANLMLKRYGGKALKESAARGRAPRHRRSRWRGGLAQFADVVARLANETPTQRYTDRDPIERESATWGAWRFPLE